MVLGISYKAYRCHPIYLNKFSTPHFPSLDGRGLRGGWSDKILISYQFYYLHANSSAFFHKPRPEHIEWGSQPKPSHVQRLCYNSKNRLICVCHAGFDSYYLRGKALIL